MSEAISRVRPACPRCGVDLSPEIAGALSLHRCPGCGGAWLDPATFRAMCEHDAAAASGSPPASAESPPAETRVRYVPCPVCAEVMSRVNFARVSGVIVDVCRPHGVWFDAGELRAVRRFVRGRGLVAYARRKTVDEHWTRDRAKARARAPASGGVATAGDVDLIDYLAGIPGPWDLPWRSPVTGYVRAGVLAIAGGLLIWGGFSASSPQRAAGAEVFGAVALVAAFRAFRHALARRRSSDEEARA